MNRAWLRRFCGSSNPITTSELLPTVHRGEIRICSVLGVSEVLGVRIDLWELGLFLLVICVELSFPNLRTCLCSKAELRSRE